MHTLSGRGNIRLPINSWQMPTPSPQLSLSPYDALLRISKTLSGRHKTMAELSAVLADQLHAIVPFDYLALLLHDEPSQSFR